MKIPPTLNIQKVDIIIGYLPKDKEYSEIGIYRGDSCLSVRKVRRCRNGHKQRISLPTFLDKETEHELRGLRDDKPIIIKFI